MLKERIQEILEFTKSESPYRKANKGWINKDIFLDLSPSVDSLKQKKEAAKITLFWSPINNLLSNIFIIIILCSLLVFISISYAKDRFDFNLFYNYEINNIQNNDENKSLNISILKEIDSPDSLNKQNHDSKNLDESNKINSLDVDSKKLDELIIDKKVDREANLTEIEINNNIQTLRNKKTKSNFI